MAHEASALRIYIDYEYLAAQQLGGLLLDLDGMFDKILYAGAPWLRQLPSAAEARLRVDAVDTGDSVTVYVIQGIAQLVGSADPALVNVIGGAGALMAIGTLIIRLLSRAEDLRAKWLDDNRRNESQKLEVAEKQLDVAGKGLELRARIDADQSRQQRLQDTVEVLADKYPDLSPGQRDELARQLQQHLDALARTVSDPNIRRVEVTSPGQDD